MIDFIKELFGWFLVFLMVLFVLSIVFTGGGVLSPEW